MAITTTKLTYGDIVKNLSTIDTIKVKQGNNAEKRVCILNSNHGILWNKHYYKVASTTGSGLCTSQTTGSDKIVTYTCEECGNTYTRNNGWNHSFVYEAHEATFTTDEYYCEYCRRCNFVNYYEVNQNTSGNATFLVKTSGSSIALKNLRLYDADNDTAGQLSLNATYKLQHSSCDNQPMCTINYAFIIESSSSTIRVRMNNGSYQTLTTTKMPGTSTYLGTYTFSGDIYPREYFEFTIAFV